MVLAAGPSAALGEPVQLVDVGGRPLVEVLVERFSGWLDPLVVVLGWKGWLKPQEWPAAAARMRPPRTITPLSWRGV